MSEKKAVMTHHGSDRIQERVGLPKKATKRSAQLALEKGIRKEQTSGSLHRYLDWLFYYNQKANNLRIFNNHTYIFIDELLVTVIPLPTKYQKTVAKLKEKKR